MRLPVKRLWWLAALAFAGTPAGAIVGPSSEGPALTPYVVMVLNYSGGTAGFCSALVVAPDAVLTAAHCVPPGAALKVFWRDAGNKPVLADVTAVVRHPDFHADAIRTRQRSIDLALVRLAAPLPDGFRPPARRAPEATAAGTTFRLAGFGLSREGDPASSGVLRVAEVVTREPLSDVLLWAKGAFPGGGACTGDSGGPVFAAGADAAVALMAWSSGTGRASCGALTQAIWLGPQEGWITATLAGWPAPSRQ